MALLPVQSVQQAGVAVAFSAAAVAGDTFSNSGQETIELANTSAAPVTVTLVAAGRCNQGSLHNTVITLPATTGRIHAKNLDPQRFSDSAGLASITYSAVASVTVAVYR